MLDEYNDFKWDGLTFSRSLEEFEASGIYYDRILLESLEAILSLKKIKIDFTDIDSLNKEEKSYIENWTNNMRSKNIDIDVT